MKFGGIVGEVKTKDQCDTSGATYSFTRNMSKNALRGKYVNSVHSFQDNFMKL